MEMLKLLRTKLHFTETLKVLLLLFHVKLELRSYFTFRDDCLFSGIISETKGEVRGQRVKQTHPEASTFVGLPGIAQD